MSTVGNISTTRNQQPHEQNGRGEEGAEHAWWRERSRVVITPVSAPSTMGLFAFSAATLMVSGDLAGWYGTSHTFIYFAPFALAFGGIGQLLAGMWSYKARDTIATVVHTMWWTFWIGFGIASASCGS